MKASDAGTKVEEPVADRLGSPGAMGNEVSPRPDRSRALTEIFDKYNASMVRFLAIRTGSAEDAKEILQEAYAKVSTLDRPRTISLLAGYLWRTAVNLAMDRKRERAVRERFGRSAACVAEEGHLAAESTCEARETLAIVDRAIGKLPPRCAEAFVLHVLKGLKQEEVGRAMGISEEAVRRHVARSFEYIQCCLEATDATRRGL